MNGTILMELGKYVERKVGQGAWEKLQTDSGLGPRLYVPLQNYPDQEAMALVSAAAHKAGVSVPALLEDFGEFIVPDLLKVYGFLVAPGWKTLDLIASAEQAIHEVIRRSNPKASPPRLKCERPSQEEVVVVYSSPRKMCGLAKGIAKGIAKHYQERVAIQERACMYRGAPQCEISIQLLPEPAGPGRAAASAVRPAAASAPGPPPTGPGR
jgi:hypothetical protein